MATKTSFDWIFEDLEEHPSFIRKSMFGGVAIYLHGLLGLLLIEDEGVKTYRGKEYPFEIWNGLLIPTYFEHQQSLLNELPILVQHPVLKKWLYLPFNEEEFENTADKIVRLLRKNDYRIGVEPKSKLKTRKKSAKSRKTKKRTKHTSRKIKV